MQLTGETKVQEGDDPEILFLMESIWGLCFAGGLKLHFVWHPECYYRDGFPAETYMQRLAAEAWSYGRYWLDISRRWTRMYFTVSVCGAGGVVVSSDGRRVIRAEPWGESRVLEDPIWTAPHINSRADIRVEKEAVIN